MNNGSMINVRQYNIDNKDPQRNSLKSIIKNNYVFRKKSNDAR